MSDRARPVTPAETRRERGLPGSDGEHELQERFGTVDRAEKFYQSSMQGALTDRMQSFVSDRRMALVGTADARSEPSVVPIFDASGPVEVVDDSTVAWACPRVAGDGGPARDVRENPHATVTMVDWWDTTVGLHVNGAATLEESPPAGIDADRGDEWVILDVEEAYIHCAKHIPKLRRVEPATAAGREDRTVDGRISERIRSFVTTRNLFFLGTVDAGGETDVSPRLGPEGFVNVLGDSWIAWPEFRGNGIHASLGNVLETGAATLTFLDWWGSDTAVRITGRAHLQDAVMGATDPTGSDKTKTWVTLDVEEVAVDHAAGLPTLAIESFDPPWGTDDEEAKKVGFFTG